MFVIFFVFIVIFIILKYILMVKGGKKTDITVSSVRNRATKLCTGGNLSEIASYFLELAEEFRDNIEAFKNKPTKASLKRGRACTYGIQKLCRSFRISAGKVDFGKDKSTKKKSK